MVSSSHLQESGLRMFHNQDKILLCLLTLFLTTFTTTIEHASFSHTLIMMFVIAFVTNYHFKIRFCEFFHGLVLFEKYLNNLPNRIYNLYICISFYFALSFWFFSDSLNAFTSSDGLVLSEPNFSFAIIFLNILCMDSRWYILAYCSNFAPDFLYRQSKAVYS